MIGWMRLLAAADGAGGGGRAPSFGETLFQFAPIILMMIVFFWVLNGPRRKEEKRRKEMISNLKRNDRVVTRGGVLGTVGDPGSLSGPNLYFAIRHGGEPQDPPPGLRLSQKG